MNRSKQSLLKPKPHGIQLATAPEPITIPWNLGPTYYAKRESFINRNRYHQNYVKKPRLKYPDQHPLAYRPEAAHRTAQSSTYQPDLPFTTMHEYYLQNHNLRREPNKRMGTRGSNRPLEYPDLQGQPKVNVKHFIV